ncbi:MAG: imelysin family protein [Pseudomonadota bacterium]
MRTLFSLLVIITVSGCGQKTPDSQFFQTLSEKLITPSYRLLTQQSQTFYTATTQCQSTLNHSNSSAIHSEWRNTMAAWQTVEWVRFGPMAELSQQWQLQFWPDKKNIIGRKMKALLNKEALSIEDVKQAGVIAQGLPAIEYVLFDDRAAHIASIQQRCKLLVLVAEQLKANTLMLYNSWIDYSAKQINTLNATQHNKTMTILVINSLVQQLDRMVNQKIASPLNLGDNNKRINAYFLESWRSDHSFNNLKHNISAIDTLFNAGGLIEYLQGHDQQPLIDNISAKLLSIKTIISSDLPLASLDLIDNPKVSQSAILPLYTELDELRNLIKGDLVNALNIRISFNASDGDS